MSNSPIVDALSRREFIQCGGFSARISNVSPSIRGGKYLRWYGVFG